MLTCEALACDRGGMRVLENISLSLSEGHALALRGPNGSGKTTLLRTLAGLQPAAGGGIEAAPDIAAYAAHSDGLKAVLTVRENLSFWARIFGQKDISHAIEAFDLSTLTDCRAAELSAGQKRRLGLARLLVTGRPVWLLDEPTVSLDATGADLFAAVVRTHLAHGGGAVIATHVDLGFEAATLDLLPFRAMPGKRITADPFLDEAF
ncbi:MAG: heme ABC exporter ATP-binding protein CcmA [Pseudomonadota bacterium]